MRDSFAEYHPLVSLIYFALVTGFSLVLTHPLAQAILLICAAVYAISISGRKSAVLLLKFCLPMALMTAVINPVFNHEGETALLHFTNGSPLTLESIFYGLSAGIMIITLILWFSSFNRVMPTDKLIYLFGKVLPSVSLILTMALRFVPEFRAQMKAVAEAQECIGRGTKNGSLREKTASAINIVSIMLTGALENAIETADSMKSRGYGLRGRTFFAIYSLQERDKLALVWLGFCGLFLAAGTMLSAFGFRYFPHIRYAAFDMTTVPFYCVLAALCLTPVILSLKEERKWKSTASEM